MYLQEGLRSQAAGRATWMELLFLVSASMASEDVDELDGIHGEEVVHVHANEPNGMWHAGIWQIHRRALYVYVYTCFPLGSCGGFVYIYMCIDCIVLER